MIVKWEPRSLLSWPNRHTWIAFWRQNACVEELLSSRWRLIGRQLLASWPKHNSFTCRTRIHSHPSQNDHYHYRIRISLGILCIQIVSSTKSLVDALHFHFMNERRTWNEIIIDTWFYYLCAYLLSFRIILFFSSFICFVSNLNM